MQGQRIGYVRGSSGDQNPERQPEQISVSGGQQQATGSGLSS
ncbi:MAG: hypothetical protein ACJAWL_002050 [Motiliproteus sp.]|jgi:hypothetical protein